MKEIRLWALETGEKNRMNAISVDTVRDSGTEQMLEELLVESPQLLMNKLRLVGRQVPTHGGPLDLLGLDETGRLVVFELKRGTLTREAVAQAIDYASDLYQMDIDALCHHLEDRSGIGGIDKISDFQDWYNQNYPNSADELKQKPRIVLVGLGVDDRTIRMVNFLADSAIDIQLLTFHAFRRDNQLFLAKQIETTSPSIKDIGVTAPRLTKKNNLTILAAKADELKVSSLLENMIAWLREKLQSYEWPGKGSYSFSLMERTERGTPTYRVYVSLYLYDNKPGQITLIFTQNAFEVAREELEKLPQVFPKIATINQKLQQVELSLTDEKWKNISNKLDEVIPAIIAGWKAKNSQDQETQEE